MLNQTISRKVANINNGEARTYLRTSASVAGTLHLKPLKSSDNWGGLATSHATASLSLAVAALGTSFTISSICMMRALRALSLMMIGHSDGHRSGTVRHRRWRMRAMSSARSDAYGQAWSLNSV